MGIYAKIFLGGVYPNVILIDKKNEGVSSARNTGLDRMTGDYVIFVDADDWCEYNMVERMVEEIGENDFVYCACYIDTETESKCIYNTVPTECYSVKDIFTPLFFGSLNKDNKNMSTALWRGMFRSDIIFENKILFDVYIRFAEDWIFYADYFRKVSSVRVIQEPLYHYYQRESSLMHEFKPASQIGIQKSIYILNKFHSIAGEMSIDSTIYEPYLYKRYLGLVLNVSKNVWNKKNKTPVKEKKKLIKYSLEWNDITKVLREMNNKNLGIIEQFWTNVIRNSNIAILSLYGIMYNCLRNVRDFLRELK